MTQPIELAEILRTAIEDSDPNDEAQFNLIMALEAINKGDLFKAVSLLRRSARTDLCREFFTIEWRQK